jgi:transposase
LELGLRVELVRRLPLPVIPPLRAIGVDDWAYRKRQRYGTILVDLERRRPVAPLHDRKAEARILELDSQALNNHQICVRPEWH